MTEQHSAFDLLMAEVRAMPIADTAKERFFAAFRAIQGQEVYVSRRALDDADRLFTAERLLRARTPRPLVRDRLMALYSVSSVTAYRIIKRVKAHG